MKYAIAIALLGVTSVSASPYYVGENLSPKNNVTLGFMDTTDKRNWNLSTGNIAALELKGSYGVTENATVELICLSICR